MWLMKVTSFTFRTANIWGNLLYLRLFIADLSILSQLHLSSVSQSVYSGLWDSKWQKHKAPDICIWTAEHSLLWQDEKINLAEQ